MFDETLTVKTGAARGTSVEHESAAEFRDVVSNREDGSVFRLSGLFSLYFIDKRIARGIREHGSYALLKFALPLLGFRNEKSPPREPEE